MKTSILNIIHTMLNSPIDVVVIFADEYQVIDAIQYLTTERPDDLNMEIDKNTMLIW